MVKKRLSTLISIIVLLIVTGVVYDFFADSSYNETFITTEVKKGDFKSFVYSTGQLQAENSVSIDVPSELSGRWINIYEIKITKLIEEGTVVDSGDYVASLDHSTVEEKLTEAITQLTEKLEAYEDAKIDTNINLSNLRDNLITARIDFEEKELILKQSIYESPAVQRQSKLDVEKAKRKVDQEERNYHLKKQQDKYKVERAEKSVERVKKQINEIEGLFNAIDIKAPAPGMLIYGFDRTGNKIKVGSTVSQWRPKIAELPDLSRMISKTFINEVDISRIKKGQKVKVGVDAFPEKEFDGEVIEVANIGQVIPGGDSKVFAVVIKISGSDADLRPAMTTSNIISTNILKDVMYIPLEAVFKNDSLSYVYKKEKPDVRQIVQLGEENENYVVIKQGLNIKDKVLLHEPDFDNDFKYIGWEIYESTVKENIKKETSDSNNQKPITFKGD